MDVVRRFSFLVTASLLGIAVMLGAVDSRSLVSPHTAGSLTGAAAYFDSTIVLARGARPRGAGGDELTVALGYLERLRLGLGSPFRLADDAAHDPRLGQTMSARVQWALLARLQRGDAYVIDPDVLDGAGPWGPDGHGATGEAHLDLIEHAITSASDPRAGELAVRLAYMLESAKGSLSWSTVGVATQVAALIRDRQTALGDLHELLADASAEHVGALQLLAERRAVNGFNVEAPPLAPLGEPLQLEAMRAVPELVRALDTLDRATVHEHSTQSLSPVIGSHFAARLSALGADRPPVAQVIVTLRSQAGERLRATNDETLTASFAALTAAPDSVRRQASLGMLSAAVALRSLAQEQPWFPGDAGPTAGDLAAEFGIDGVAFARGVPGAWRPYYLRELGNGLRDVQSVLPAFSVDGLRIRFGTEPLRDSALAMHDPRTRTLQLSIFTSGGTIAHELSHDLDWQTSRRLFAGSGGYSSDRAMAESRGALSSSLRGLAEARLLRPFGPVTPPAAGRPAELFARAADWFVASSLAQKGRINGFLSAIEDGLLGGYAAGQPTAIGTAGARSLTSAIGEMTYLRDSTRDAYETQWSDPRTIDPVLLVRRALETPVSSRSVWQRRPGIAAAFPAGPAQLCIGDDSPSSRAREEILMLSVDARARGMALRRARYRPSGVRADWANSIRGIAPWSPDDGRRILDGLRSAIVAELTTALPDQGVLPAVPAIFRSNAASCSSIAR